MEVEGEGVGGFRRRKGIDCATRANSDLEVVIFL